MSVVYNDEYYYAVLGDIKQVTAPQAISYSGIAIGRFKILASDISDIQYIKCNDSIDVYPASSTVNVSCSSQTFANKINKITFTLSVYGGRGHFTSTPTSILIKFKLDVDSIVNRNTDLNVIKYFSNSGFGINDTSNIVAQDSNYSSASTFTLNKYIINDVNQANFLTSFDNSSEKTSFGMSKAYTFWQTPIIQNKFLIGDNPIYFVHKDDGIIPEVRTTTAPFKGTFYSNYVCLSWNATDQKILKKEFSNLNEILNGQKISEWTSWKSLSDNRSGIFGVIVGAGGGGGGGHSNKRDWLAAGGGGGASVVFYLDVQYLDSIGYAVIFASGVGGAGGAGDTGMGHGNDGGAGDGSAIYLIKKDLIMTGENFALAILNGNLRFITAGGGGGGAAAQNGSKRDPGAGGKIQYSKWLSEIEQYFPQDWDPAKPDIHELEVLGLYIITCYYGKSGLAYNSSYITNFISSYTIPINCLLNKPTETSVQNLTDTNTVVFSDTYTKTYALHYGIGPVGLQVKNSDGRPISYCGGAGGASLLSYIGTGASYWFENSYYRGCGGPGGTTNDKDSSTRDGKKGADGGVLIAGNLTWE